VCGFIDKLRNRNKENIANNDLSMVTSIVNGNDNKLTLSYYGRLTSEVTQHNGSCLTDLIGL